MGWVGMLYVSQSVVNLILSGDIRRVHGRGGTIILASLLTALVMTTWDLTMDPYMVTKVKAWVWDSPGEYLGIPFANYISWVELTFMISITYRIWERDLGPMPEPAPNAWVAAIPLFIYGVTGLSDVLVGSPIVTRIVSPFSMGVAIMAALGRLLWKAENGQEAQGGEA
jgi:uncharacterized membrane protein